MKTNQKTKPEKIMMMKMMKQRFFTVASSFNQLPVNCASNLQRLGFPKLRIKIIQGLR